jgi:hypothetical protein
LPIQAQTNSFVRFIVGYVPTATPDFTAGLWLIVQVDQEDIESVTVNASPHDQASTIVVGGSLTPIVSTPRDGISLRCVTVKQDALNSNEVDAFSNLARAFVDTPLFVRDEENSTDNAVLRVTPQYQDETTNPYGIVGGPGEVWPLLAWTPVERDYVLDRGYVHLAHQRPVLEVEFINPPRNTSRRWCRSPRPCRRSHPGSRSVPTTRARASASLRSTPPSTRASPCSPTCAARCSTRTRRW